MVDGSPEDDAWLRALVDRSPLVPEPALRAHWRTLIPGLPVTARYELAAILVEVERSLPCA
ncbi:MAG TPA: hypothetical protein VGE94_04415 [Chloroflexota bacterium]|jgi:hypothetical protein